MPSCDLNSLIPSSQPVTTKDDICRFSSLFSDDQKFDIFLKPEPNILKRRNSPDSFRMKYVHRFRFFEVIPDLEIFFLRGRLAAEGCVSTALPRGAFYLR